MRILHILDHSLPLHSGYAFRSQEIFHAQRQRGWEPLVVTSPKHEESWKGDWQEQETIEGVSYHRTGGIRATRFPFITEARLMRALVGRILDVAAREKPDVLHAHSPVLNALPALWAGRKLGIPVVYEIRAFWEDAAVDHGAYAENSWKYRLTKAVETWACRRADHVCILCEGLKRDLVGRGIPEAKLTPIFNGIDPDSFTSCPPDAEFREKWGLQGKRVIGFIGSFYRYEGLELLMRAFARVRLECPDTALLLVGGGEMEASLRELARELGIEKEVVMPGRIPHQRIPGVYAMMDVLAYPRQRMRLTELVTPLKPLEAMAMGKMLVASDVGGNKELIRDGETGLLFEAGNLDALTSGLLRAARDEGLREKLRGNGPAWVRAHHTWARTTAAYLDVYAHVLGGRDAGRRPGRMVVGPAKPAGADGSGMASHAASE